ncbi:hypothetical protein DEJ24_04960 [Curtobacterium sp. MCPF17_001]|uniref:oligosaccharide flippase family protein n=1 Tax=Curtobacterium sp. MCPF17_001 TaxID=2175651 RepID=UPI000DA77045|nr:oligosaccharide flippase family protein [Curtobacterium sp. MCPF17_001]PZE61608.1 hypothetical protein DEJ24_04960 [Curtobacterium sp. MCPF17_001]
MSTFSLAFRGARVLLVSQLLIGVGQFVYSGATARVFTPTQFGSFTGILGLQALLILVTTTGLPSLIMHRDVLTNRDLGWIRLYALVGGALAAAAFYLATPLWADLLRALDEYQYRPLLTLSLLIFPIASVESALLRREGRPTADALSILSAFVVPAVTALIVAVTSRHPWALALVPVLNPAVLGILSHLARKQRYRAGAPTSHREFLAFSWNVSRQNVVFFVMGQAPAWALSSTVGARSLGAFNRANSLAASLSTPLTTALNRATQAHWRRLIGDPRGAVVAMRDATLVSSSVAFPLFAMLIALAPQLTSVWLGAGWGQVGALVPGLAVAAALQVPFSLLAASLEMRGFFRKVRLGQVGLALGAALTIITLLVTRDPILTSVGVAVTQGIGLLALMTTVAGSSVRDFFTLLLRAAVPAGWAILIGGGAFLGAQAVHFLPVNLVISPEVAACLSGGTAGGLTWLVTLRWQPIAALLARRNVRLPRFMRRH